MITLSRHDDEPYMKKLKDGKDEGPIIDERELFGKPLAET
jgi:hypothetical protein